MSDTEIGALRQKLANRVRSDDYRQRRKDMDAAFSQYRVAPDVTVEPVTANGVRASGHRPRMTIATRRCSGCTAAVM
jgi:hypothetical protein